MYNLFYHLFRNIILNRYQKHKKKIIYIYNYFLKMYLNKKNLNNIFLRYKTLQI